MATNTTTRTRRESASPEKQEPDLPDKVKEEAKRTARTVRDTAGEEADRLRREIRERAGEARREAEERADRWSTSLGRRTAHFARAIRSGATALREEGEDGAAELAEGAADQVERACGYLEDETPTEMVNDLEEAGRRSPGTFLGTSLALGMLAGRFLRSSRPTDGDGAGPAHSAEEGPGRSDHVRRPKPPGAPAPERQEGPSLEYEGSGHPGGRPVNVKADAPSSAPSGASVAEDEEESHGR